jgi:hypothetical protein
MTMAKQYDSPDDWFDSTDPGVPWGAVDYGDRSDPGKVDSLRKNAWAINRAVYVGIPDKLYEINGKLDRIIAHLGI